MCIYTVALLCCFMEDLVASACCSVPQSLASPDCFSFNKSDSIFEITSMWDDLANVEGFSHCWLVEAKTFTASLTFLARIAKCRRGGVTHTEGTRHPCVHHERALWRRGHWEPLWQDPTGLRRASVTSAQGQHSPQESRTLHLHIRNHRWADLHLWCSLLCTDLEQSTEDNKTLD